MRSRVTHEVIPSKVKCAQTKTDAQRYKARAETFNMAERRQPAKKVVKFTILAVEHACLQITAIGSQVVDY